MRATDHTWSFTAANSDEPLLSVLLLLRWFRLIVRLVVPVHLFFFILRPVEGLLCCDLCVVYRLYIHLQLVLLPDIIITHQKQNCHIYILLRRNSILFLESGLRFVRRFSSKRPAVLKTRLLADVDAGTQRTRQATLNSCGSKARFSFQNSVVSTSFAVFVFT